MMQHEQPVLPEGTMGARDFVQRIWAKEIALTKAHGGTKPEGWTVTVHPAEWVNIVTDEWVGDPSCPIRPGPLNGPAARWEVFGIPILADLTVPLGEIRLRIEVVA